MFVAAYVVIVGLTVILVIMNVRSVVQQFAKDRNVVRLYSYLATLLIMAVLITGVTSAVVTRVIDSEALLQQPDATDVVRYMRH